MSCWINDCQKAADTLFDTPAIVETCYRYLATASGVTQVHDIFNEVRQRAKINNTTDEAC